MTGAGAVTALVLLEWTVGWVAVSAWSQSWGVVRRGHFRITAWGSLILGLLSGFAIFASLRSLTGVGSTETLVVVGGVLLVLYPAAQYSNTDLPAVVVGACAGAFGLYLMFDVAAYLDAWQRLLAGLHLAIGALLLGGVTNGMMLGHWYLNQPGLKPWALARLTNTSLLVCGASLALGLLTVAPLASASTEGAALGIPGFGQDFGIFFYGIWVALVGFTGAVVWMARRCIQIKSIQSATGLYYVAILTAGVAEFVLRYLMVNAS
ncbi:MAG: hypothetical protein ACRDJL_10660 [Actinomycetota bacterium]